MGNLPKFGEKTNIEKQPEIQTKQIKTNKNTAFSQLMPASIIVPRPSLGHTTAKYSIYLSDIKEIDSLLKEIKSILQQQNNEDKVQLFCAKVNYLNLYIESLKKKYTDGPEKYYESYKQLLVLDRYLTEIVDYKRGIEKYKEISSGTLKDETADKKYLKQKVENAITPINTVIEIIDETG